MAHHYDTDLYGYAPTLGATVLFIVLFALTTFHHAYVVIRHKCLYFIPFVVGGAFQVIGYGVRVYSANHRTDVGPYAAEQVFILLPPALYAASIYMTLGRLLTYIHAEFASIVRVKWMTRTFVVGDVISFIMQGGGAGLQGSGGNHQQTGSNIVVGGLVVQIVFFGGFVITSFIAHRRITKRNYNPQTPGRLQWSPVLYTMYFASALILVRSTFRVVEYAMGWASYTMTHEVFMYIFDALPMFCVMVLFNVIHPAYCMVPRKDEGVEFLQVESVEPKA
ncbi:protein Rta1p [Trichomonascus vanleenenianus]|uniref:RTA1 domain-containing protein n=1 Tax=Trichomonascus vanleenenianus TaxID=2268995 RepID=UPI003ECB3A11